VESEAGIGPFVIEPFFKDMLIWGRFDMPPIAAVLGADSSDL
jgi:hypothetical protein